MKRSLPKADSQHQNNSVQCQTGDNSQDNSAFVDNRQSAMQMRQLMSVMENSDKAITQRQFTEQIHMSPRMIAQRQHAEQINNRQHMIAQRREINTIRGIPVQRVNARSNGMHTRICQQKEKSNQAAANILPQSGASAVSVSPLTDRHMENGAEQALQVIEGNSSGVQRKKNASGHG